MHPAKMIEVQTREGLLAYHRLCAECRYRAMPAPAPLTLADGVGTSALTCDRPTAVDVCRMAGGWLAGATVATAEAVPVALAVSPLATFRNPLVGLDAQTRVIYHSLASLPDRYHLLLTGPTATGKTSLVKALLAWIGPRHAWQVDASTLTKAGLETELLAKAKRGRLPPILYIEECEKGKSNDLACLLQVLDSRGRIQRTNAHQGDTSAVATPLLIMTCNDTKRLRRRAEGEAIWSRTAVKVVFHRPDARQMMAILMSHSNNKTHCAYAVSLMYGVLRSWATLEHDDPRLGLWLLSYGDRLLDGTAEADLRAMHSP